MSSVHAAQSRLWLTQVWGEINSLHHLDSVKAQAIPGLEKTGFFIVLLLPGLGSGCAFEVV